MKLTIGMPVFERAWILPTWFDCLEAQELAPKEDITLCFAHTEGFDGTYDILRRRGDEYGGLLIYDFDLKAYDDRMDMARFHELSALRNGLLDMAIETNGDYFLSWDNDILFPPRSLQHLFEPAATDVGVGALMDMGGRDDIMAHPSYMTFGGTPDEVAFRRPYDNPTEPFEVDIIMAVKLMGREAYSGTRYRWDFIGEDIGWCHSAEEHGFKRILQPRSHGIHLYDKQSSINALREVRGKSYIEKYERLVTWYA